MHSASCGCAQCTVHGARCIESQNDKTPDQQLSIRVSKISRQTNLYKHDNQCPGEEYNNNVSLYNNIANSDNIIYKGKCNNNE